MCWYAFKLVVFFACHLLINGENARFDNYRIYSIKIQSGKQLELLQNLENTPDGISFLENPISMKQNAEMLVPPHKFADVGDFFEKFGIVNEIKVDNIQQ